MVVALEALGSGPARVAYVARADGMWTLPLYELALHTTAWAKERGAALEVAVVTAEPTALQAFGPDVSERVWDRLRHDGVRLITRVELDRIDDGVLRLVHGPGIPADLTVALPRLNGPALRGLPHLSNGFTRVDDVGRVVGAEDIYAVGDMTDRPFKQGALAAEQGEVAARTIVGGARRASAGSTYRPELRASLNGAGVPLLLRNPAAKANVDADSVPWPKNAGLGARLGPLMDARGVRWPAARTRPPQGVSVAWC